MTTSQPSAHIALNNNRLRAYADVIYLKDGDEFQIELFNPYQVSVLAKIYINDNLISSSGLVIRPGQRYFLDRYIDKNKKFKFNTYMVDSGATPEVLESIKKNGSVKVEFYAEKQVLSSPNWNGTTAAPWNNPTWTVYPNQIMYSTNTIACGSTNAAFYSNTSNTIGAIGSKGPEGPVGVRLDSLETGRIEGGSKSNQSFGTTNQDFEWFTCAVSEWKILPDSHRPVEVKEIRNYCSGCGTRMKKQSWKFCPNCGEKLD
jgi:hypothetical protein